MGEIDNVDYTQLLEEISMRLSNVENSLNLVVTFLFIFMIVVACKFVYSHFNMFFK